MINIDKATIARENNFDLNGKHMASHRKRKYYRMNVQSFAITCWTKVCSKNSF